MRPRRPLSLHRRLSRLISLTLGVLRVCGLAAVALPAVAAQILELSVGRIAGPAFALEGVVARLALSTPQRLVLTVGEARVGDMRWRDLRVDCARARIDTGGIECLDGRIGSEAGLRLDVRWRPGAGLFELTAAGPGGERWWLRRRAQTGLLEMQVEEGNLGRFIRLLPEGGPRVSAGRVSGRASARPLAGGLALTARGQVRGLAFSDAAGLRAGEGIGLRFALSATRTEAWRGQTEVEWDAGEVFWSPFYFGPGVRRLSLRGSVSPTAIEVSEGTLAWTGMGRVFFAGRWDRARAALARLSARSDGLALGPAYDLLVRPLFPGRFAAQLDLAGTARFDLEAQEGRVERCDLEVSAGRVGHRQGLMSLDDIDLQIPWRRQTETQGWLRVGGGRLKDIALGGFAAPVALRGDAAQVARVEIPVADGRLELSGLRLARSAAGWQAEGSAALTPVSMERLATGLGWPPMHGSLSAVVPRVEWRGDMLAVDGALLFRVFDGTVVAKHLQVEGLGGPASRARADVDMRHLDLDLITRTFAFGRMEGRIDVTVADLELVRGRPVRFSASVASSAGDYPRRISQRAVDNIAALGGGSATAALQKSFLRFFEDFRYRRIGLAGRLDQGVLTLSGLGEHNGGFLIVEGGGIPALSVIGYNRQVGWNELLERLSRIRQGKAPVIR